MIMNAISRRTSDVESGVSSCKFKLARGGVVLGCLIFYVTWASVLPIDQSPDEVTRLAVPFWIVRHGALPSGFEESIRNHVWGISYAFTPYGNSLLSALLIKIALGLGLPATTQVVAARLSSCLCGALTVYVIMLIGEELGFCKPAILMMGLFLGLLPQFAFLSSYLNNDIFSALCSSLVILAWIRGLRDKWAVADCVLLGASLGLLSLSYYFAYAFIPVSVAVYFASAVHEGLKPKVLFARALLVLAIALLVGGWFFARNAIIYSGDFLGMRSYSECAELYASQGYKPSDHVTPKMLDSAFMSPLFTFEWIKATLQSSISFLGYMQYPLRGWAYWAMLLFVGACCASAVVPGLGPHLFSKSGISGKGNRQILAFALLACFTAPILFSAYRSWAVDWQPQGRYIIASWMVLLLPVGGGLDRFLSFVQARSERIAKTVPAVCVGLSVCLLLVAIHSFYPAGFCGVASEAPSDPAVMANLSW